MWAAIRKEVEKMRGEDEKDEGRRKMDEGRREMDDRRKESVERRKMDEKRTNKIRTVRDLNVYRKVFLSSLFLAKRSSFVPRFSQSEAFL